MMNTAKDEVRALLDSLPEDCTFEDVQYHLYVVEKVQHGISRAEKEGAIPHSDVERKFEKWTKK
jgi:hypothetical protein